MMQTLDSGQDVSVSDGGGGEVGGVQTTFLPHPPSPFPPLDLLAPCSFPGV